MVETEMSSENVRKALLSRADGNRSVIEFDSVARAFGLEAEALHRLRVEGATNLSRN